MRLSKIKRRHEHPDDRNGAPLWFRRELFEALFSYAVHLSARRRQKAGVRPAPINQVAERGQIWIQPREGQGKLLELYARHAHYIERDQPLSLRTLQRHTAALKRDRLVAIGNYSRYDRERGTWIQEPNVYTITRAGVLWIKRHARALQIPRFV